MRFRGRSYMAFVLSPEPPIADWLAELGKSIRGSAGFFLGRPAVLDLASVKLSNQAIAHLMIAPPLSAHGRTLKVFATHPATEDRIARLSGMAGGVEHRHETLTEGRASPRSDAATV